MYSFVIPFHDDYKKVLKTVRLIEDKKEIYEIEEILLCHNGKKLSTQAEIELKSLGGLSKYLHTDRPGIGAGYRLGLLNSQSKYTVLSASDLPFGFTDLENIKKKNITPEFVIGSKWVSGSVLEGYGFLRKQSSFLFWFLRFFLLGKETPRDSQGTIVVETCKGRDVLNEVVSDNYFFSLEFITIMQSKGFKIYEVPVKLENHSSDSSVSLIRDGWSMFKDLINLRRKIKK